MSTDRQPIEEVIRQDLAELELLKCALEASLPEKETDE